MNTDFARSYAYKKAKSAKIASKTMATSSVGCRNASLEAIAAAIDSGFAEIVRANRIDVGDAIEAGLESHIISRLSLTKEKILHISKSLRAITRSEDPLGKEGSTSIRPNGLSVDRVRVPLGVVAVIYESRPDVTVEATAMCIKSGNSIILRGGREAINTNKCLVNIISSAIQGAGLPEDAIQFIDETDYSIIKELMTMPDLVDVVIPRGGKNLMDVLHKISSVPILESGRGNCHVYVDSEANDKMALDIILNSKVQSPSACNAAEKLLVHKAIAESLLPLAVGAMQKARVEVVGCQQSRNIVPAIKEATSNDWHEEYLKLKIAVKIVSSVDEAIAHINSYSTGHSDAIITESQTNAEKFLTGVDSAAVYHNASTRFTDGGQFGFGGEIGISTQKLHARGPIGLKELTTVKYIIHGHGQIRGGTTPKIAVLGGGMMGSLIAKCLACTKALGQEAVIVTGRNKENLDLLKSDGITVEQDNKVAVSASDVVLLCVKPIDLEPLLQEISKESTGKLVISIVAGVSTKFLQRRLGSARIVRAMPNICAMTGKSLTAICHGQNISEADKRLVEQIFSYLGEVIITEEKKMATFTGICGSGPAYLFYLANVLMELIEKESFSTEDAREISAKLMLNSAGVLLESSYSIEDLISMVASKKGTTEAGLRIANNSSITVDFQNMFAYAIRRAKELEK